MLVDGIEFFDAVFFSELGSRKKAGHRFRHITHAAAFVKDFITARLL
jgi:hypothetical protein